MISCPDRTCVFEDLENCPDINDSSCTALDLQMGAHQCSDGNCIPPFAFCDKINDCDDDEPEGCTPKNLLDLGPSPGGPGVDRGSDIGDPEAHSGKDF